MTKNRTIQIYRGTTTQNDAYTGSAGELTMDTTNNQLRLHDGTTAGGHIIGASSYHPDLFTFQWADHESNDVQWLRADTFSWQSGATYEAAYQHLADDISGKSLTSETISGVTVQFYLADDGHKICPASQESNVASIYSATGVAWYYIIDTTNTRFKLPRSKHNKYTTTLGVAGNGKALALTTGTNSGSLMSDANASYNPLMTNSINVNVGASVSNAGWTAGKAIGVTTDATTSGLTTTSMAQETDQYKYLYFYVGNFTQTALENTAGLNASLFNNKADIDLGNLNTAGKEVVAHLSMPSSRKDDLTLGASGATYTAPADGWVYLSKTAGVSGTKIEMRNITCNFRTSSVISVSTGHWLYCSIQASKGDSIEVTYTATGTTNTFKFIYANGAS